MSLRRPKNPQHACMDRGGWVYIMTNRPNGTLYIGVTGNLARRAYEHREGLVDGFTKQHSLKHLVWYERFEDIRDAIAHEKRMKTWLRAWKTRAIMQTNPAWNDLYETLA
jgi:putative endonuclease